MLQYHLRPASRHCWFQEMIEGELKLFFHPEMQISLMFLCSLIFMIILSRLLLFLACHVHCSYRWVLMCTELFFEGLRLGFFITSCSSSRALKKMLQLMFFPQMLTTVALQNSWIMCMAYKFSLPTFLFACSFSGSDHFLVCLGGGIISLHFTELTLFMTSDNTSL